MNNFLINFIQDMLKNHLNYLTDEMIHTLVAYARKLLSYDYFDVYMTSSMIYENYFSPTDWIECRE